MTPALKIMDAWQKLFGLAIMARDVASLRASHEKPMCNILPQLVAVSVKDQAKHHKDIEALIEALERAGVRVTII